MPHALSREIGHRIRERRTRLGLSQEELAQRCRLHRTYVGMVERAEKSISVLALARFAKALETELSELLKGL
jgi:transcriptional regulator with XRE-family HTH domain